MPSALAAAHIEGEARIRAATVRAVGGIWRSLPGYDRENVDEWVSRVVPITLAAQRQSVRLTEAYLARAMERRPIGLRVEDLIGAGARNGAAPEEVYERSLVTVWTALGSGSLWRDAVASGFARATSTAALDVQLAMARTAQEVGRTDNAIQRYRRVADPGACEFCQTVDGAILLSADAMPLHNHCGCGIEPLTEELDPTPVPESVAVNNHGEVGPVLGDPAHDFTAL